MTKKQRALRRQEKHLKEKQEKRRQQMFAQGLGLSSQKKAFSKKPTYSHRSDSDQYQSFDSGNGHPVKKETIKYTGTNLIGIGMMHKSNLVPIFNDEQAKDISTMRRN